jgi:hypothetical protein
MKLWVQTPVPPKQKKGKEKLARCDDIAYNPSYTGGRDWKD